MDADALGPSTASRVRVRSLGPGDPLEFAGSRSIGTTDDGYLLDAATLPLAGDGWRVYPAFHDRQLHFGTQELVATIERTAATVRASYPDSVLSVGNLSGRFGGPIRYSRSHQNGRDVDIGFFLVDEHGAPAQTNDLVRIRCNRRGRPPHRELRFDVPRNWGVVASLVGDAHVDVQVIFVLPCLRRALLRHAKALEVDHDLWKRAASVLRRPSRGSYSHDDHFHVRLYCTRDDLLLGCRNDGRTWDWTRVHEGVVFENEEAALRAGLKSDHPEKRIGVLRTIALEDRKALARPVIRLLDDPSPQVRAAALDTTRALASSDVISRLRRRLERTDDPAEALTLLATLRAFEAPAPRTARLLEHVAQAPAEALAAPLSPEQSVHARVAAVQALAVLGRSRTPRALIRLLDEPTPEVRAAAEESLAWLTNHRPALPSEATPADHRAHWQGWWAETRRHSADLHLRDGFLAAGVEVPSSLRRWSAVRSLVAAIPRGGALSWNAQQVLRRFAGEHAPRVPHDHPEAAWPVWRGWLGSRLPAGALDPIDDNEPTVRGPGR